eukprot:758563-Hanusia_phi.AAC.1
MSESPTKQQLNAQLAIEIYKKREDGNEKTIKSSIVALQYGMSPKAIRDIWNRRTWFDMKVARSMTWPLPCCFRSHATEFLWTVEEREEYYSHRRCLQCRLAQNGDDNGSDCDLADECIAEFCSVCALHTGPGRPVGSKDSKPRKKKIRTGYNMLANPSKSLHLKPQEFPNSCHIEPENITSLRRHEQEYQNEFLKPGQTQSPPPDFDAFFLPEHHAYEGETVEKRRDQPIRCAEIHSELTDHMLSGSLLASGQDTQEISGSSLICGPSQEPMPGSAPTLLEDAVNKQQNALQTWDNFWP